MRKGTKTGKPAWNRGLRHSSETRRKIGEKSKGRKHNIGRKRPDLSERNRLTKTGSKHSEETKTKIGLATKGRNLADKNPMWKGGITPLNKMIRTSTEYKLWRTAVFARDGYACVWGGKEHGSKLQADHIKPFALYPELRFAIDNGRTLCVACHRKTDTYGGRVYRQRTS